MCLQLIDLASYPPLPGQGVIRERLTHSTFYAGNVAQSEARCGYRQAGATHHMLMHGVATDKRGQHIACSCSEVKRKGEIEDLGISKRRTWMGWADASVCN